MERILSRIYNWQAETQEFLDRFAATYTIPRNEVTVEVFTESFLKALAPMPGIEDILKELRTAGVIISMLSDTSAMFAGARNTGILSEYFDHVFLSFEIGFKKPDPRAFKTVIDYYKFAPSQIYFIDNNKVNIEAAEELGFKATVFIDSKTLRHDLQTAGII